MKGGKSLGLCLVLSAAVAVFAFGAAGEEATEEKRAEKKAAQEERQDRAKGQEKPPVDRHRGPGMHPPRTDRMNDWQGKEVRELVETVLMVRLSKELELTDEQTVLIVRRLKDAKEKAGDLSRERAEAMRALREAVRRGDSDKEIEECLDRLIEADRKLAGFRLEAYEQAGEGLSVPQRARLYVFVHEFEDHLRHMIAKAREQYSSMGRGRPEVRRRAQPDEVGEGHRERRQPPTGRRPAEPGEGDAKGARGKGESAKE